MDLEVNDKPLKIVHVIPSLNLGGAEVFTVQLCGALKALDPSSAVSLISLYPKVENRLYQEAIENGTDVFFLNKRRGFDPIVIVQLFRLLSRLNPDIIHAHLSGLFYAAFSGMFIRVNKIYTVHYDPAVAISPFLRCLYKIVFNSMGFFPIALSAKQAHKIKSLYGCDSKVIFNGIRVKDMGGDVISRKKYYMDLFSLPEASQIVLSVGRLSPEKDQISLLKAFNLISREDCHLLILGGSRGVKQYEKNIKNLKISLPKNIRDRIHFLGERQDVPELMSISDVFILSSVNEGMPITILEAMAYKVPIVSTDVGNVSEILDEQNAVIVQSNNPEMLADGLRALLNNPQKKHNNANRAYNRFKDRFDIQKSAACYFKIYRSSMKYAE